MKGVIFTTLIILLVACTPENIQEENIETKTIGGNLKMKLTSSAFEHNGAIPSKFTCDGDDTSPPLDIVDVPENAKSLALIMDDPDAPVGTWDHWIVYNIPATVNEIPQGTEPQGIGGKNSWGRIGYGGPCPPSGTHRYFFKLYALDRELDLPEGSSKEELEKAMEGHIIEKTELMGTYEKK